MRNILIGGAWPYANGSLHIGHIAALLPGDVLARYFRARGDSVYYVSGSDCHGTPVTIRARQEGKTPREISDCYHAEFVQVFSKLGFSYDLYGKTSSPEHIAIVQAFHKRLYEGGYVYEKTAPQAFCAGCQKTLTDRLVVGICPYCGKNARGDQCDDCGAVLEAESLKSPQCAECGSIVTFTSTKQLYIAISRLEKELRGYLAAHPEWRKNAITITKRYIDEGLRDRAITRDLEWGINVPKAGYENKRIYIWAENVLGYLSASHTLAKERGVPFETVWGDNAKHYYVHGKDNVPFHTIILPSLLIGHGGGLRLPDSIISSEHMTLNGRKISTSRNWAIWVKDIIDRYDADALRYFFIANGPEKRDTDFSWQEFLERTNSELLGAYGNLVNRTLAFITKYRGGIVPGGTLEEEIAGRIRTLFDTTAEKTEDGQFKNALEEIFEFVRFGNKYYDVHEPWKTKTANPAKCDQTLYTCVQIIANLAVLLGPFLPFSSEKLFTWLAVTNKWVFQSVPAGLVLPEISVLFRRIDREEITMEEEKLNHYDLMIDNHDAVRHPNG
jgi:methionyl-tRNA synthetase